MPISRYNPDGSVDIFNRKTGEVRRGVKPEELSTISPNLVTEYQQNLRGQDEAKVQAEAITSGVIKPDTNTPINVLQLLQAGGYKPKEEKSADQLKQEQQDESGKYLRREAISSIDKVLGTDTKGMTGSSQLAARIPLLATDTKATVGEFDKLKSLLSLENIKYLKGTGQISDAEQKILQSAALSIPENRQISDEDFRKILVDTRNKLSQNLENVPQGQPQTTNPDVTGNPLTDTLKNIPILGSVLGPAINTANDIGMAGRSKQLQPTLDELNTTAEDLIKYSDKVKDPVQKKKLTDEASALLDQVIEMSNQNVKGYSKDVNQGAAERGLKTGVSVASTAELLSGILSAANWGKNALSGKGAQSVSTIAPESGGLTGKAVSAVEKAKQYTPKSIFGRKQAEEAAKVVVKKDIPTTLKEGVSKIAQADPDIAKIFTKEEAGALTQIKDLPSLLERMSYWGKNAYNSSGGVKAGAKGELYKQFYNTGLKILKEEAPDAYKYRQLIKYTYDMPKAAGKLLWRVFLGGSIIKGMQ